MSIAIQSYQLNKREVKIDLEQVPVLSDVSKNILKNWGVELPSEFPSLKGRISTLNSTTKMLKEAKEGSIKNKIIAFLKTAFMVVLAAAVIAAFIFGGEIALVCGILGLGAYMLLALHFSFQAARKITDIEKGSPNYSEPWYSSDLSKWDPRMLLLIIGGFIMPLFEAYTKESRLEKVIEDQQGCIKAIRDSTKNQEILETAHKFFKGNSRKLIERLEDKIRQIEFPTPTDQQAKKELEALVQFYSDLDKQ